MEADLGSDLVEGPGQEVGASHPRFEEPGLHCIENTFVLPALDPL
jgi:hypothetical protein